mmetsp:Transcript_5818/g.17304  ORF Transcript_5818/g.17304 Transcript_5818/m.17304 type:complete len:204 (+) Transcript_5818:1072-1683(+)
MPDSRSALATSAMASSALEQSPPLPRLRQSRGMEAPTASADSTGLPRPKDLARGSDCSGEADQAASARNFQLQITMMSPTSAQRRRSQLDPVDGLSQPSASKTRPAASSSAESQAGSAAEALCWQTTNMAAWYASRQSESARAPPVQLLASVWTHQARAPATWPDAATTSRPIRQRSRNSGSAAAAVAGWTQTSQHSAAALAR